MDLVIRNAVLDRSGEPVEVGIEDGVITAVQRDGLPQGKKEIDAEGCMISPALVEPHFRNSGWLDSAASALPGDPRRQRRS